LRNWNLHWSHKVFRFLVSLDFSYSLRFKINSFTFSRYGCITIKSKTNSWTPGGNWQLFLGKKKWRKLTINRFAP
jgi:hypothetical protein